MCVKCLSLIHFVSHLIHCVSHLKRRVHVCQTSHLFPLSAPIHFDVRGILSSPPLKISWAIYLSILIFMFNFSNLLRASIINIFCMQKTPTCYRVVCCWQTNCHCNPGSENHWKFDISFYCLLPKNLDFSTKKTLTPSTLRRVSASCCSSLAWNMFSWFGFLGQKYQNYKTIWLSICRHIMWCQVLGDNKILSHCSSNANDGKMSKFYIETFESNWMKLAIKCESERELAKEVLGWTG